MARQKKTKKSASTGKNSLGDSETIHPTPYLRHSPKKGQAKKQEKGQENELGGNLASQKGQENASSGQPLEHSGHFFQEPEQLASIVNAAPLSCGTYLWYGYGHGHGGLDGGVGRLDGGVGGGIGDVRTGANLLYVGKARNLRNRLKSYLSSGSEAKTRALLREARKVDWIVTETEEEALLLEAYLVKTHQPKYNIRLKDDKRYPYLCLTMGEAFPQLRITREKKKKNTKHQYFGPYTDVRATRNLLAFVDKTFLLRKKKQNLPLPKKRLPCLNFHIGRCLAPCQGDLAPEDYGKIVEQVSLFLAGKHQPLMNKLQEEMQEASRRQAYEKAAMARNVLRSISKFSQARSILHNEEEADLIALAILPAAEKAKASGGSASVDMGASATNAAADIARTGTDIAQVIILQLRNGNIFHRLAFLLEGVRPQTLRADIICSFLRDYYLEQAPPARIICPDLMRHKPKLTETELSSLALLQQALQNRWGRKVRILRSIRNHGMYRLARKNAWTLLHEYQLAKHNRKQREKGLYQLQELLGLRQLPTVLECFDISHSSGQATSASCVQFIDGLPHPAAYRRYRIRTVSEHHIDDFQAMYEVLLRRLKRLQREESTLPDLLLIDGGAGQLSAASRAVADAGIAGGELPIAALAKENEELYYEKRVLRLAKDHPALILLRHIRDEAHRFAVKYHKLRRQRSTFA